MRSRSVTVMTLVILLAWTTAAWAAGPMEPQDLASASEPTSLEELAASEALQALRDAGIELSADAPSSAYRMDSQARTDARELSQPLDSMTASGFKCLPTCAVNDGRFMAVAGDNLITLSDPVLNLQIIVEAGSSQFEIGVFDGDGFGMDGLGNTHWDVGTPDTEYRYRLFADPSGDSTGTTLLELQPGSPFISSFDMADNEWTSFTVSNDPAAQAPSGNFFYRLEVELVNPAATTLNNFKVRTGGAIVLQPGSQPFSYYASWTNIADISIIYPEFPLVTPTTYDGTFSFFFDVFGSQDAVSVWGGDFDRGKFDGTEQDTDDPDTPGDPFLPPWATADARFEGVAQGLPGTTGNPADDRNGAGLGVYLLRSPSVVFDLIIPDGRTFSNPNPSGNQEWEQFHVSTEPFDRTIMDHSTPDRLPSGAYELRVSGVDMQNLNAVFLDFVLLCQDEQGLPCQALRPYLVGDTVFLDENGNGVQDSGEPGIEGVTLRLLDQQGEEIASTVTDDNGNYQFQVNASTLTVQLASENFEPGGVLEGFDITTAGDNGGTEQTNTVIDDNVLTYDFGVRAPGSIGDRIWFDADADGEQDAGEAGINGVTVRLLDEDGNEVATAVTSGDGMYLFEGVGPGIYTVDVDESTLPAGVVLTTGNEPFDVDLGQGEDFLDADFGYVLSASLGDRVWHDVDQDGEQDAGEVGLNGVTVRLLDEDGNEIASTVTAGDGEYLFDGLLPGTYTVQVDISTLPDGFQPTADGDGLATPHTVTVILAAGDAVRTADFGYALCGECKGKVSRLTLRYDGAAPAEIIVKGRRGPSKGEVLFSGVVQPGGSFEVVGPDTGNGGFRGTVGTEIQIYVDGVKNTEIHTSCSVPIGPGQVSGDFTILAAASKHGGVLCPVNGGVCCDGEPGGGGDDGGGGDEPDSPGTGTLGYWKNHSDAWPSQEIEIGGLTLSKHDALDLLRSPSRGQTIMILVHQLIPAKLNVMIGNDAGCIQDTIDAADEWVNDWLRWRRPSNREGKDLAERLDDYNNGRLCAPHRG